MEIIKHKNRIFLIITKYIFIFGIFWVSSNLAFAFDTYSTQETITIGEFIYNDDYSPTADDCTITIYNPSLGLEVNNVTMTDEGTSAQTGWHYYTYLTGTEEGKYPAYITCGSELTGDLFKLDKSFVVKAGSSVTSEDISSAVTAINSNVDSKTSSLASTLLSLPSDIWNFSTRTLSSFGTLASEIATEVWSSPTRSLTMFGNLVNDIWSNSTRTLTSGGESLTASDIWSYATRNLTDGTLTSGSLAKVSDLSGLATATNVTNATQGLATTAQLTAATSPLATSAMLALVKTNTDTIDWTDVTTIKNNASTLISEIGTGNITGIKTKTDTIDWTDVTGIVTDTGLVKAKTDTINWSNVTDILTDTGTIAWSDVTGIKSKTDTILWTDIAALATSAQLSSAVSPLATTADVTSSTSAITGAIGSLNNISAADVWSSPSRSLTTFGNLVADIWTNTTRTITGGTTTSSNMLAASDIWSYATRNLTDGTLTSGSLAKVSDLSGLATATNVTNATQGLATTAQLTAATSPLATSAMLALVKTNTDTIDWTDVTTIKNNASTLISEIGTGNITGIKTKTDTIDWTDISGLVTSNGLIKGKTDTIAWNDVTGIKTKTDTISWSDVTGIKTKTDTILWSDIALLAAKTDLTSAVASVNSNTNSQLASAVTSVNTNTNNSLTASVASITSQISNIPANVWDYTSRSLTNFGTLVADVWNHTTRTLTSITLSSSSPWSVTMSDFGTITAGSLYLTTVNTIYNGTLTDSANLPTITIYDSNRNVVVNAAPMTRTSVGTYGYSYLTNASAAAGVWESLISVTVETGKTLPGNDYWNVTTTPAQVIINSITDNSIPQVSSNITITNEGLSGNEYQYEWCVVNNINNPCGGNDDIFHAVAAKYINAGEDFNTNLTADVINPGSYFFKVIVYFGTESSGASRSFTAITSNEGGGHGGGGGGGSVQTNNNCRKADFNCDKKINSIDFSILLYYWKSLAPFKNKTVDINNDKKVDSVDFSILLYEWGKNY